MFKGILALVVIVIAVADVREAVSGDFGRRSVSRHMDWESSNCSLPSEPYMSCYDEYSCEQLIQEFNDFVDESNNYINCVFSEVDDDLDMIQDVLRDGAGEAQTEVANSVEDTRTDLERELETNGFSLR